MAATAVSVAPFGVEADDDRNGDIVLISLPSTRVRSRIKSTRTVSFKDPKTGKVSQRIPTDQARALGPLPEVPGMQIHVDPAERVYRIIDGMTREMGEELAQAMRYSDESMRAIAPSKFIPVPDQVGVMDEHHFKTLVRELYRLVKSGGARVIKGVLPDEEDIDALPGKYLYAPGPNYFSVTLPRFEEDVAAWQEKLTFTAM